MKKLFSFILSLTCCLNMLLAQGNGPVGFVNCNDLGDFGITGGGNGQVVHVATRAEFRKYCTGTTPYVIILDADLTGGGMQDLQDEQSIGSNKTIIGSGSGKAFNGICLDLSGQHNVIFRNIKLQKGRTDGMSFRNCHHIWVDHCDLSDSYDGLLDFTVGSDYLTVSWTKLHDHNKVSIINSGTCHYEDYGKEHVTYAHCWFANNTQRNPRIGYGKAHIYNCYWTNISSYCIGVHSQAQAFSEYNYFTSTAKKAFENQYSTVLPYCGYLTDNGSFLDGSNPKTASSYTYKDISYKPDDYYSYTFDQTGVTDVPADIQNGVGPHDGLLYQPILNPGNGAINVPASLKLTWGNMDGVSQVKTYFGTSEDDLAEVDLNTVQRQPATTYYWKVIFIVDGQEYSSPVYQFTTAAETPSVSYPSDGATDPWLRYPSSQYEFCTNMPLSWHTAYDAKSYNIYLSDDESQLDANLIGSTSSLSITPGSLTVGKKYYWRVDAVRTDGSVVKGTVWSFSTPEKLITEGKNELEALYLSGITFTESNRNYSGGKRTVGDQGPGSIVGIWNGPAGRYAINTAYYCETTGENTFGISINGKLIDKWYSATDNSSLATRKTRRTQLLNPGDEIRVEFIAGPKNKSAASEARARLDYINIVATDEEFIDVKRPSATYHSPDITTTYDCEYLRMKTTLFKDTLGVYGDYNSWQITDEYCSWISYLGKSIRIDGNGNPMLSATDSLVFYIKEAELAKFFAPSAKLKMLCQEVGASEITTIEGTDSVVIEIDRLKKYKFTLLASEGEFGLQLAKFYKVKPAPYVYHTPEITDPYDCEFIWSTSMIFLDSQGTKGEAGKNQIASPYDEWCQYYNPSANEVQAKNGSNAVYYLDPVTDQACSKKSITSGSGYCYIVGTQKSMTYYLSNCSKVKIYYTGSGGAATSLHLEITDMDAGTTTTVQGENATGKSVASNAVEAELTPGHNYKVLIIADTGDMLVYATKLWQGTATLLGDANNDGNIDVADITTIAAYILGTDADLNISLINADANQDGVIDVADITTVATLILQ